jgi:hypothetical protein
VVKLTESVIEDFAIELFERRGYHCVYVPNIAPAAPIRYEAAMTK